MADSDRRSPPRVDQGARHCVTQKLSKAIGERIKAFLETQKMV